MFALLVKTYCYSLFNRKLNGSYHNYLLDKCYFLEILTEIENLYENFVKEKDLTVVRKATNTLLKIQVLFGRCQELGDEKISIVQQVS